MAAPNPESCVPCQGGMCEHSDGRGPAYDGSKCFCRQCPNKELCGLSKWCPPEYMDNIFGGYCMQCAKNFRWGALEFRECPEGETCAVCLESGRQVKFMADGCTHWFCVPCTRQLVYWDETRYHLDPCAFGCPPCPNGCDNPAQGRQCDCEEHDPVIEAWSKQDPKKFDDGEELHVAYCEWAAAMGECIEAGEPPESSYGKKQCPLCKRRI